MSRTSMLAGGLAVATLLAAGHAIADDLDATTQKAIKSACHGNLLDDGDFEFLARYFDFRSPLCEEIRDAGDDFDYSGAFEKHEVRLTQEDLRRIYEPGYRSQRTAGEIELECTYNVPGGPVGVDSKCQSIRELLAEKDIDVSLTEYQTAEKHCDGHHGCIDDWAERRVRALSRSSQLGNGPSLDDLMGDSNSQGRGDMFDQAMAARAEKPGATVEAEVGFDNIYAARETNRINEIKQALFDKGEVIASSCQCAFNQTACFEGYNFAYDHLNQAMSQGRPQFESEMDHICMTWTSNLRGATSDDEGLLSRHLRDSDSILSSIDKLHKEFNEFNSMLAHKAGDLDRAEQQQQQAQSGFQWGKFAALATGTVIGASMGDLSGADTIEVLGNVAMDSMAGAEGANNTMQGMDSITQRHLAELETERSIRQQQQTVDARQQAQQQSVPVAQTNQSAYSYDDFLASNNVQQQPTGTINSTSGGRGPWGAIAFARDKSQSHYGFVVNKSSRQEALNAALNDCGSNCSYQTSGAGSSDTAFKDFCAAVYLGTLSGGTEYRHFFGYHGSSTSAAESDALGSCGYNRKVHNPGMTCQFVTSGCSGN